MKELLGFYYEWVTAIVGPMIDQIPFGLGQSWVFWIVVWFFLVDPPILIAIFANKALASRHAGVLDEVGLFRAGSISAKKILHLSRISDARSTEASVKDGLSKIQRWLWFGYLWQVLFWFSFILVISYLIPRSS